MQKIRCANSVNNGKLVNICIIMLPLFHYKEIPEDARSIQLDEDTSKHIVQVLRMKMQERLELTDGRGNLSVVEIIDDHKKKVVVKILETIHKTEAQRKISIGISLLKNASRFEWFLEKATEIGIGEIIPLICDRTERQHFRVDRMQSILVSAMLQSKQYWLPKLHEPIQFRDIVQKADQEQKFIAHCIEGDKLRLPECLNTASSQIMLIGPEGDFTLDEVTLAMKKQFAPVSLGDNRLRTETAGVVAAVLLKLNS